MRVKAAIRVTKRGIALRREHQHATTVAARAISAESALSLRKRGNSRRRPATDATSPATSPATAPTRLPVVWVAVPVPVLVPVATSSATNAASTATLLGTVRRVDTAAATTVLDMAAGTEEARAAERRATPVVATATCLETARRVRNATTVSLLVLDVTVAQSNTPVGGEVGHLSRDCPSEASSERVCYKCKQPGHLQSQCPN